MDTFPGLSAGLTSFTHVKCAKEVPDPYLGNTALYGNTHMKKPREQTRIFYILVHVISACYRHVIAHVLRVKNVCNTHQKDAV